MSPNPETAADRPISRRATLVLAGAMGASFIWASWTTLREIVGRWEGDPRYAHGYLVPVFAAVLLWLRRDRLASAAPRPSWWGLPILAAGLGLRLASAYYFMEWFDSLAMLSSLAGIAVLLGGWPALRWSWPAIGFLFFMVPLPYRLEVGLAQPLQGLATRLSTFAIQATGLHALAEGNVIVLDDNTRIGVVEACSGLSMLFTFFAISTGLTLVIQRRLLDKVLIILGAVPIAIFANVTRITVTAVLHELVGSRLANLVFHDLAGWLMMPLAMALLLVELHLISRLLIEPKPAGPEPIAATGPAEGFLYVPGRATARPGAPPGASPPRPRIH